MPDGTSSIIQYTWDGAKAIGIFILGVVGWQVKRQVNRVDILEKNTVNSDTFNNTIKSLRDDFKIHADRVEKGIARTHERIDKILDK